MPVGEKWAERGKIRFITGTYDDETIRVAKEVGANLVHIGFSSTLGERERWNWKLIKPFVKKCHENGLKVSFYMKLTNIYWKPMFHELPESKKWVMICQDGKPALYLGGPNRFMGCVNNPGWRQYLKDIIKVAIEHEPDALFFDNYFIPRDLKDSRWACYCDVCRELFKSYTRKNLGRECIIPARADWDDPVWQAFIKFRDKSLVDITQMISRFAKRLKPNIGIYPNLCPPWFSGGGGKGSNTHEIAKAVDFLLFEGNRHPRLDTPPMGGIPRPFNAAIDWKYGLAVGDGPVIYAYYIPEGTYTPDSLKLGIAESSSFGGVYYTPSAETLAKDKEKAEAVKQYFTFLKQNEQFYEGVKPIADVAIHISMPTINWYYPDCVAKGLDKPQSIQAMGQALTELHIPFDVVLEEDVASGLSHRVLILPNVACLSDKKAGVITEFVRRGGGLVATNITSLYDENYRMRKDYALARVFGVHHGEEAEDIVKNTFGRGVSAYLSGSPEEEYWRERLPRSHHLIEGAVAYTLRDDWQIQVEAPSTTVINLMGKRETGTTLLHLLNYETRRPVVEISVKLRKPKDKIPKRATLLSPDFKEARILEIREEAKTIGFSIPRLEIYNLVVIEWK